MYTMSNLYLMPLLLVLNYAVAVTVPKPQQASKRARNQQI